MVHEPLKRYPDSPDYPYVAGFENAPETPQPTDCEISEGGHIPRWLNGVLYRGGPGIWDVNVSSKNTIFSFDHWFDGLSLMHRFHIHDGSVTYMSRIMCPKQLKHIEDGKAAPITFGRDPCATLFSKVSALFLRAVSESVPESNINVTTTTHFPVRLKGKSENTSDGGNVFSNEICVKTDGNVMLAFDRDTLERKKEFSYRQFDRDLKNFMATSHEEYDPVSRTFYNQVALDGGRYGYNLFEFGQDDGAYRKCIIETGDPVAYIHSFSTTKKYAVLMVAPYFVQYSGLSILWEQSFTGGCKWDPDTPLKFYVVDRENMQLVAKYRASKSYWFFHTINAYDSGDDIVIDVCLTEDAQSIDALRLRNLRDFSGGMAVEVGKASRFVLKNVSDASRNIDMFHECETVKILAECTVELPRINDFVNSNGQTYRHNPEYRYIYGVSKDSNVKSHFFNSLVKIDVKEGTFARYSPGNGMTPSEPIFYPRPGATEEDDGVVLSVVLDGKKRESMLVVLDAKTLTEIAKAKCPQVVPHGFHGAFDPKQI